NMRDSIENVSLLEASSRILAENIKAVEDLPPYSRSAVDGYAVRAEDTFGASPENPAYLSLEGEIEIGEKPQKSLKPGSAIYIPTGAELPAAADSCLMIEDSEKFGSQIEVMNSVSAGENIIKKGDDIKADQLLLEKGRQLSSAEIGALAGLGYAQAEVFTRPEIAIISSGDELIPPGSQRKGSSIYDINSYLLGSLFKEWGLKPSLKGIVTDNKAELKAKIEESLTADIIVISGGSSVGVKDYTIEVINSIAEPGVFLHGLAVKPGKPTILGRLNETPIIGLPGNPSSAWVVAAIVIPAIINQMRGLPLETRAEFFKNSITARLSEPISSTPGRQEYFPVKLTEKKQARPLYGKSNLITTLVDSDGLIVIPPGSEGLAQGSQVEIIPYPPIKGLIFKEQDIDG
ncbi:MAG: gephyrin-like molybdotransferase Glp, partial [Halarsenatibacteraceae bacterium]